MLKQSLIQLGQPRRQTILEQKLTAGGLADQIDYMAERECSTERHLLEDVQRRPGTLSRADEANRTGRTRGMSRGSPSCATGPATPHGPAMMIDVQDRLRRIAREQTALIGDHTYECLIGMAGLLTHECVVWWSSRFPIEGDPT